MNNEQLRKELYTKIQNHHGAIAEVANRLQMHRNTVSQILRGAYENLEVLNMAAQVLKEREEVAANQRFTTAALLEEAVQLAMS